MSDNTTQTPLQGEWGETTITLAGSHETKTGKELVGTGLGYWIGAPEDEKDDESPFYQPTHIPSGHACCPDRFYSEEHCQNYIKELAPLLNWNQSLEELIADPGYPPKQFTEIYHKYILKDAADTACGGAW